MLMLSECVWAALWDNEILKVFIFTFYITQNTFY